MGLILCTSYGKEILLDALVDFTEDPCKISEKYQRTNVWNRVWIMSQNSDEFIHHLNLVSAAEYSPVLPPLRPSEKG